MIYKTIQGDTWDTISYKAYGSEFYTNELFEANPKLQHVFIFAANQDINVPDVDREVVETLPPWLRPESVDDPDENNELLSIINGYDSSQAYVLSYRFVSNFNAIVTKSSKLEG